MREGFGRHDKNQPSLDGSIIVGFLLVMAASFGAFVWVDEVGGRYNSEPVRVYQQEAKAGDHGSALRDSIQPIDEVITSSVASSADAPSSLPLCDIDACAKAYRSFRVADCTFQPYEGPRRQCTR